MAFFTLNFPKSRGWGKDFGAGGAFWRWSQEAEWRRGDNEKGKEEENALWRLIKASTIANGGSLFCWNSFERYRMPPRIFHPGNRGWGIYPRSPVLHVERKFQGRERHLHKLKWDTVVMSSARWGLEWEVGQVGATWGPKNIFSTYYNNLHPLPPSLRKMLWFDLSWTVCLNAFEYLLNRNRFTPYSMWSVLLCVVTEWETRAIRESASVFCFHNPYVPATPFMEKGPCRVFPSQAEPTQPYHSPFLQASDSDHQPCHTSLISACIFANSSYSSISSLQKLSLHFYTAL